VDERIFHLPAASPAHITSSGRLDVTMPVVTECLRRLEPVTRDPFIDGLHNPASKQPGGRLVARGTFAAA
jgi:hypothetical protein